MVSFASKLAHKWEFVFKGKAMNSLSVATRNSLGTILQKNTPALSDLFSFSKIEKQPNVVKSVNGIVGRLSDTQMTKMVNITVNPATFYYIAFRYPLCYLSLANVLRRDPLYGKEILESVLLSYLHSLDAFIITDVSAIASNKLPFSGDDLVYAKVLALSARALKQLP